MANKDGGVDTHISKAPILSSIYTEYGGCSAGHISAKPREHAADFQSTGLATNVDQLPEASPFLQTDTDSGMDVTSVYSQNNAMDFQCKDRSKSVDQLSNVHSVSRTDTEISTVYYSPKSRASTLDSMMKRQARGRVATDEYAEKPKRVTWCV